MEHQESPPPRLDLERYRGYLQVVARMGLDPDLRGKLDPSDIVQQTFLEAHRARKDFVGEDSAQQAAWVKQILVRNLVDAERALRRGRRDVARERAIEETIAQSSGRLEHWLMKEQPSPSQEVAREEQVLLLADALTTLPEEEQEALLCRYCQGESLDSIGERLAVSRKVVSRLISQGIKTLREKLRELG